MFLDGDYITGLSCSDHAMFCPASRAPELSNFHYGCQFQEKGLDLLLCLEDPHFFKLPGLTPTQLLCNYKIIKWYAILSNIFINIFVDKRQKDQKRVPNCDVRAVLIADGSRMSKMIFPNTGIQMRSWWTDFCTCTQVDIFLSLPEIRFGFSNPPSLAALLMQLFSGLVHMISSIWSKLEVKGPSRKKYKKSARNTKTAGENPIYCRKKSKNFRKKFKKN